MTSNPDNSNDPQSTTPPRPLHYERHLAWPWSLGQSDPVKLQSFARRAAIFRRIGCLVALAIAALIMGLLILLAKQSGMLR